jgi:hypothetical protein
MYSPKIDERLVPVLYLTAKDRGVPMTRLVDSIITDGLLREQIPNPAQEYLDAYIRQLEPQPYQPNF